MAGTRSLGNLVVRLAVELAQYKAEWKEAEAATREGAGKVDQASQAAAKGSNALKDALKQQTGAFGEATAGALEHAQAARMGIVAASGLAIGLGAVAAAAIAVAYAASEGSKENRKLNDSLILTGNYAGLAAGRMDQMALSVAASIGGTVGNAREVLASLVSTGQFTVDSLGSVSEAVQLVARFSGQTNEEVLKNFASMGDGVAKWAAKANESYHFLDLATYRYIQRLEDQGRTQDAIRVTSEALSKHLGGDLTQNLGFAERAWLALQRAASSAWAAMKEVGKPETTQTMLARNSEYLERAKGGFMANDPRLAMLQARNFDLLRRGEREERVAGDRSAEAQATEKAIKAEEAWGKIVERNRTRAEQMTDAIKQMRIEGEKNGQSAAAMDEQEQRIRKRYEERKAKGITEAERERRLIAELSGVNADYLEQLNRLSRARDAGNLSEERYIALVTELIGKQPMAKKLIEEQVKETERLAKADIEAGKAREYHLAQLDKGLDKLNAEIEKEKEHTRTLGLTKEAIAALVAAKLEDQAVTLHNQAIRDLDKKGDEAAYDLTMRQVAALRSLAQAKRDGAAREAEVDSMKKKEEEWGKFVDGMDRTFRDGYNAMLQKGDDAWRAWGRSLVNTFKTDVADAVYRMFARPAMLNIVGNVMGGASGMAGSVGSTAIGAGTSALGNAGMSALGGGLFNTMATAYTAGSTSVGVMAGSIAGGGGIMGGVASALSSIPVAGWIAAAAVALYSMFGSKGGGPKTESGYAGAGGNLQIETAFGDPSGAKQISEGISGSYAALAKELGLVNQKLDVGVYYAMDNHKNGTAQTLLQVSSSTGYDRNARLGGIENVERGEDALKAALAEETTRVIFEALKSSDLPQVYKEWLNAVAADAGVADMEAAIKHVTTANAERKQLEAAMFELTATDLEKLNRVRDAERAAVDESNRALLEQVYAQQDAKAAIGEFNELMLQTAAAEAAAAKAGQDFLQKIRDMAGQAWDKALQDKVQAVADAEQNLVDAQHKLLDAYEREFQPLIDELLGQADRLAQARDAIDFGAQSGLSIDGRYEAAKRALTGANATNAPELVSRFLDAAKIRASSAADYLAETDRGRAVLKAQEDAARLQANDMAAQINATRLLMGPLNDILTVEEAQLGVQNAQAALDRARLDLSNFQAVPPGFANGGVASGVVRVGERGAEVVDFRTPGRVYTAEQTAGMFAPNDNLAAAIGALAEEVSNLRYEVRAGVTHNFEAKQFLRTLKEDGVYVRNHPSGEKLLTEPTV